MPKKKKYPWYEARQCFRKQVKLPDGATKTIYAKTELEMDKKLARIALEVQAGLDLEENPTTIQYAIRWYELNTPGLSSARKADYANAINIYILPVIGYKRIREVVQEDGKKILAAMSGRSRSLQSNVVAALKRMFSDAEDDGIIVRSPMSKLRAGGKVPDEKIPLTDEQAIELLEAVKATRVYPFVMIGLYAGLRREEILGLRWENVCLDTSAPYIAVRERVTFMPSGAALHEKALKSRSAKRNIPLPTQLAEVLNGLPRNGDFVVPDAKGRPQSKSAFNSMWRSVTCRRARGDVEKGSSPDNHPAVVRLIDFHVTPHILRHTYLTNLCRSGLNLKIIQYLAGHSKVQMTMNIYVHATENRPEDLVGIINSAFAPKAEKDTKTDTKVVDMLEVLAAQGA